MLVAGGGFEAGDTSEVDDLFKSREAVSVLADMLGTESRDLELTDFFRSFSVWEHCGTPGCVAARFSASFT